MRLQNNFLNDCRFRTWHGISLLSTGNAQVKTIRQGTLFIMEQNTKQVSPITHSHMVIKEQYQSLIKH